MIIPSEKCNNHIILFGRVNLFLEETARQFASCQLETGDGVFQCLFALNIETSKCIEGKYIRLVGQLKTDKHGDMYIMVNGYRLACRDGKYAVNKPKDWDISWPERWSE